jgi:hypothetical protein
MLDLFNKLKDRKRYLMHFKIIRLLIYRNDLYNLNINNFYTKITLIFYSFQIGYINDYEFSFFHF